MFGNTTLKEVFKNFGSDVDMTLNPFIFGSEKDPTCFDENSPCLLEQTSMCAIHVAQQQDAEGPSLPGQKMYVPWLSCMDGTSDKTQECCTQVGISDSSVKECLNTTIKTLLPEYFKVDEPIQGTPTVHVNGKDVGNPSYAAIKSAICGADPSLSGCSAPDPHDAHRHFPISKRPHQIIV